MSASAAIALFDKDCCTSVFHAELAELRVHVYPRKLMPGFVWILRGGKMDFDDPNACVIDGDMAPTSFNIHDAAALAMEKLFLAAANGQSAEESK